MSREPKMTASEVLFALIRMEVFGNTPDDGFSEIAAQQDLSVLYEISKKFDIAQIIASALSRLSCLDTSDAANCFRKELALAAYRYERMNYDYERICKLFRAENIPYIPLKGAVVRKFYPQPWMRTSCDIDILVREEDVARAVNALVDKLSFSWDGLRDYHDISVFSESKTHVEVHFSVKENMDSLDGLLEKAWDYAVPEKENDCKYGFTGEFLLFHTLSHMSYHIICGGCGIKPFIDLFALMKQIKYDKDVLSEMCRKCGIDKLQSAVEQLLGVWFEGKDHNEITEELQYYVLSGSLYGNLETGTFVRKLKYGGKLKYLISLVFQPYDIIKEKHPVLKKHKWLMPVYQVKRWFILLTSKRGKKAGSYTKAGIKGSDNFESRKLDLLKKLELC